MPLKERWSRWRSRKSNSSASSSGDHCSDMHPEPVFPPSAAKFPPAPTSHSSWRPSKMPTWRGSHTATETSGRAVRRHSLAKRKTTDKSAPRKRPHPRERPMTEQNMRHQELLGTFTMKFGTRRASDYTGGAMGDVDWEKISPRTSVVSFLCDTPMYESSECWEEERMDEDEEEVQEQDDDEEKRREEREERMLPPARNFNKPRGPALKPLVSVAYLTRLLEQMKEPGDPGPL